MLRREFLLGFAAGSAATVALNDPASGETIARIGTLKVGSFIWRPELSPSGAVVVVVSLPEQLVHVYRNGVAIGVSTCSTGKPGHRTPTGVFTILEKDKKHFSSTYNNAPMPNMQRLTWTGVALHAGNLPGYPASHGCVRLPDKFASRLFEVTHLGTAVIIVDKATAFGSVVHPKLVLDPSIAAMAERAEKKNTKTAKTKTGWSTEVARNTSTVLISGADKRSYLLTNGKLVHSGSIVVSNPERPLGNKLYSLSGWSRGTNSLIWQVYGFGAERGGSTMVSRRTDPTLARISFLDETSTREVARTLVAGTSMIVTDYPADPTSRSGPDFTVMVATESTPQRKRKG